MNRFWLYLLLISVLTGCSADLERKDIPVSFGVRLDDPIPVAKFRADMQRLRAYHPQEIVLELYVNAHDSTGLPYIDRTCRAQLPKLLPVLQELNLQPSLVFSESPDRPLFFRDTTDFRRWFAHYAFEIERVLERTAGYPLRCLVFGNEFRELETRPADEWRTLIDSLRADCDAKLVYTTLPSRLQAVTFWPLVDEIGVAYMPAPDGNHKKSHRAWNRAVSAIAEQYNKPIFVSHANVISEYKTLQFKNKTRFWAEDVTVTGLTLNTIFGQSIISDTSRYFGAANATDFQAYLKEYTAE